MPHLQGKNPSAVESPMSGRGLSVDTHAGPVTNTGWRVAWRWGRVVLLLTALGVLAVNLSRCLHQRSSDAKGTDAGVAGDR